MLHFSIKNETHPLEGADYPDLRSVAAVCNPGEKTEVEITETKKGKLISSKIIVGTLKGSKFTYTDGQETKVEKVDFVMPW